MIRVLLHMSQSIAPKRPAAHRLFQMNSRALGAAIPYRLHHGVRLSAMTDSSNRSAPLAEALLGAAQLIAAVLGGRNFDVALTRAALPGPLRAATMDLAYTTLRAFGRGDFLLGLLLERPVNDPAAHGLLLAALARLEARQEEAHTTVDQAVTAAARVARGQFKGLVNGVLRNFLRRREELLVLAAADPVSRWQHPAWWIARLRQDHPAQ